MLHQFASCLAVLGLLSSVAEAKTKMKMKAKASLEETAEDETPATDGPVTRAEFEELKKRVADMESDVVDVRAEKENRSENLRKSYSYDLLLGTNYRFFNKKDASLSINSHRLTLGTYLNSDFKISLGLGVSTFKNKLETTLVTYDYGYPQSVDKSYSSDGSGTDIAIGMQKFLGNTTLMGLNFVYTDGKYDAVKAKFMYADFVFGSQYSWKTFNMTWDWISVSYIVKHEVAGVDMTKGKDALKEGYMGLVCGMSFGAAF